MKMTIFAALVVATPVLAQEPATPLATNAGRTTGQWQRAGDLDTYNISLPAGDWSIGGRVIEEGIGEMAVRAPDGSLVGRKVTIADPQTAGLEFRSKGGTYRINLREGGSNPPYPIHYNFIIKPDCRATSSTTCRIAPGQTKQSYRTAANDIDWHRLTGLTAGRTYTVTVGSGGGQLAIVNAQGTAVPSPDGKFKATTGTLFAKLTPLSSEDAPYSLTLH